MTNASSYSPGLAGVIAGESAISCIDVERNRLILRGYDLVDLTDGGATFEEVAYLLLHDDLPNAGQLAAFRDVMLFERQLPDVVLKLLEAAPAKAHPMALLRSNASNRRLISWIEATCGRRANRQPAVLGNPESRSALGSP